MIKNAKITLPLEEFDELRLGDSAYREIAQKIAACFEYKCKEYSVPAKCKTCKKENPDCTKCKVFKESPPWEEILTVDVERLINVAKQYALYGQDITSDVEEMSLVIKKSEGEDK